MKKIEVHDQDSIKIETSVANPPLKKKKMKKKKTKNLKEKKCSGLKELLNQINQQKLEKMKKTKEKGKIECINNEDINMNKNSVEEKNKENINIINRTISGTTLPSLSENSNKFESIDLKTNYIKKHLESIEDEIFENEIPTNKRKFSSPIFSYYEGFDKILIETQKNSIDMTNSLNFVKKEDFFSSHRSINNNNSNIINDYNSKDNINKINPKENYNEIINEKDINHDNREFFQNDIDNDDINIYNQDYSNISYSHFIDYCNKTIPEIDYKSKFNALNNILKNKNRKNFNKRKQNCNNQKTNSKIFRKGDWLCIFCLNMNFSFRTLCNRCQTPKYNL